MSKIKWFVSIAILAYAVNYLNEPLPKDLPGWWQSKLFLGLFKAIFTLTSLGSDLGYDWAVLFRNGAYIASQVVPRSIVEGVTVTDSNFDGIPVKIFKPPADELTGKGLVYFPGGGWVMTQLGFYVDRVSRAAKELGAVVIYVDYRLAPKHPFPAAAEDCIASYKYFVEHADKYNVDPDRIAVIGESAGGNLAAVVSLFTLTTGYKPVPKLQVLLAPVLQGSNLQTPSYKANKDGPFLSQKSMAYFIAAYIFGEGYEKYTTTILNNNHTSPGEKKTNANNHLSVEHLPQDDFIETYTEHLHFGDSKLWNHIKDKIRNHLFAPIFAENLTGLTPDYISTCQYDVLRDDGYFYAKRLRDAKVKVEHNNAICIHSWAVMSTFIKEYYDEYTKVISFMDKNM